MGTNIVKLVASTLSVLSACVFASLYSFASERVFIMQQPGDQLPRITQAVTSVCPYAYLLPLVVVVCGALLLRRRPPRPVAFESVVSLGSLLAFAYVLAALVSWQVAFIPIVHLNR